MQPFGAAGQAYVTNHLCYGGALGIFVKYIVTLIPGYACWLPRWSVWVWYPMSPHILE